MIWACLKDHTLTPLLDAKETAKILNISERSLWTLTNNGTIPHIRFGRSIRYDPSDLARWITKQKRKSAGKPADLTVTDGAVPQPVKKSKRRRRRG
jgi:excisionase family DNA binding protein